MTMIDVRLAQQALAAQPFNDLVGARLTAFEENRAVLELDILDHHRQQFGLVHGGVLAYCADNALTFAAGTVLGPDILTTEVTLRYLHPARDGRLRTTAVVDHCDGRRALGSARIEAIAADGSTTLCALAHGAARLAGKAVTA